jgi:LysM repeat protein
MCHAEFVADAPFKQHFLDAHGLDDDPGTETRLPEDAPPPDPPEEAPARKPRARRGRSGRVAPAVDGADGLGADNSAGDGDVALSDADGAAAVAAVPVDAAAVDASEGPEGPAAEPSADPVIQVDLDDDREAIVVAIPEPIVVIPVADPAREPDRSTGLRLVTAAGVVVVALAFVLAAGRLTGGDQPARAAVVPSATVPAASVPPPGEAPPPPAAGQYVVVRGDSLSKIAARFGVGVDALIAANAIADPNLIWSGQVLTIPG